VTARRAIVVVLLLAACGGSSKHLATTTAAKSTAPATVAPSQPPRTTTTSPPPEAHAEIPALYTVTNGGSVIPSTISVPAAIPVELTVLSRDGRAHTATLKGHTLRIPAGGRASVLISGLNAARYPLTIDGRDRGTLVIGTQPGP
jgi:hypothetical protein